MLSEAQAVAKLNHPNIVTVHDAGEIEGTPYIVMELVEGESLYKHPPDGFEGMISMAKDVSAALEHAHSHEIIHRDLKPENIVIATDGMAKLMDFGLARSMATRVSVEGEIIGTVFYIAPETAMGQDIDGRADLYSLGVILYEQAAGELPFVHEDPLAIVSQHLHATVLPPRAKNPEIPPVLEELILQLLSKDPDDRPESAAALLKLLDNPDLLDPDAETEKELSVIARIARGRFVAREGELEQAKAVWSKALGGQGQTLLISGEPGIGKTRLVRELATHVEVSGGRALIGECYSEGGAPYAPFAQVIRRGLRGTSQNGFEVPDFVMADLLTLAPELRPYCTDVPPNPSLEPEAEQHRLFENVVSFCDGLAEHSPLMIVIDDAHWGDSSTLAMMRHLARRTRDQRILLVTTYREVELDIARPLHEVLLDINRARLATRLKLERLDEDQTRDLLDAIFEEETSREFLEGIYRETEGNPFFIEEVCKALVEEGKLYYADGEWHRPSMEELEIPQSVRVAIQTRVAKLPEPFQEVLSMAAVLGREFEFEVLAEASELDEDTVIDALEAAETVQLIEETGEADEDRFMFVHALIPVALLDGVRKLRRRKLHRRAANAIEALHSEDYEALAYHYSEAGDDENALIYYVKAGERAAAAFANSEAEGLLRSALDLSDDSAANAELLVQLGKVLTRQGRYDDAISAWYESIALLMQLMEQDRAASIYALASGAAWDGGDPVHGLEIAKEGVADLADAVEGPGLADLYHELSRAYFFNNLKGEGTQYAQRALSIAEDVGDLRVHSESLITLGTFAEMPLKESIAMNEQGLEIAREAGLLDQESRALNNLTHPYSFGLGELDKAHGYIVRAGEIAASTGNTGIESFYKISSAHSATFLGNLGEARDTLDRVDVLLQTLDDPGQSGRGFRSMRATLLRHLGEFDEATQMLKEIVQESIEAGDGNIIYQSAINLGGLAAETGQGLEGAEHALKACMESAPHWGGTAWPLCSLSAVRSRLGDKEGALQHLSRAKAILRKSNWVLDGVWISMAEARLAIVDARWEDAWTRYREATDEMRHVKMRSYLAETLLEWSTHHGQRGDSDRAKELLEQSKIEFEDIGAPIYAQIAGDRMAEIEARG